MPGEGLLSSVGPVCRALRSSWVQIPTGPTLRFFLKNNLDFHLARMSQSVRDVKVSVSVYLFARKKNTFIQTFNILQKCYLKIIET